MSFADDDMYREMAERSRIPAPPRILAPQLTEAQIVRRQAEAELAGEEFKRQVAAEKARIRARRNRTFWQKLFPWKLVRRDS